MAASSATGRISMASTTHEISKEMYLKGFSIARIAEALGKSTKTIQNYKSRDGDWDEQKAAELIANAKTTGESIYNKFTEQMYQAIKEITDDEKLSSKEKASSISQVGDSFVKMQRVANLEDPKSYKLSIAREVIRLIVAEFQVKNDKNALKTLVELLESSEFLRKIESLD